MNSSLLLVLRSGAGQALGVGEAIDAALVCAAFGMQVSLLFEGDGLAYLDGERFDLLFEHAAPGEFHRIMAVRPQSTLAPHLPFKPEQVEWLSISEVSEVLSASQEILVA